MPLLTSFYLVSALISNDLKEKKNNNSKKRNEQWSKGIHNTEMHRKLLNQFCNTPILQPICFMCWNPKPESSEPEPGPERNRARSRRKDAEDKQREKGEKLNRNRFLNQSCDMFSCEGFRPVLQSRRVRYNFRIVLSLCVDYSIIMHTKWENEWFLRFFVLPQKKEIGPNNLFPIIVLFAWRSTTTGIDAFKTMWLSSFTESNFCPCNENLTREKKITNLKFNVMFGRFRLSLTYHFQIKTWWILACFSEVFPFRFFVWWFSNGASLRFSLFYFMSVIVFSFVY